MRILFIGNDLTTASLVERMLRTSEVAVDTVESVDEGYDFVNLYTYDIAIVDSTTADGTPLDLVRTLRNDRKGIPLMLLSAEGDTANTVKALSLGADDVLCKPFHRDEIAARVHALVRRASGHSTSTIEIGDLVVDIAGQSVHVAGNRLSLTGREYQIVEAMAMRPGSTLTKEMFLDRLYAGVDEPEMKIIDVYMCKIRKKLKAASGGLDYIDTIWGRGYCLIDPAKATKAA